MDSITVMGVDPSSNYVGISLLEIDLKTMELISVETHLIDLTIFVNTNVLLDNLTFRLNILSVLFSRFLNEYSPEFVCCESGFINRLRPAAVIPLASAIALMRNCLNRFDPISVLDLYPPTVVKNAVGAKGNADKDGVELAVKNHIELKHLLDTKTISEHEVDATAVGMCKVREIRNNEILLLIN